MLLAATATTSSISALPTADARDPVPSHRTLSETIKFQRTVNAPCLVSAVPRVQWRRPGRHAAVSSRCAGSCGNSPPKGWGLLLAWLAKAMNPAASAPEECRQPVQHCPDRWNRMQIHRYAPEMPTSAKDLERRFDDRSPAPAGLPDGGWHTISLPPSRQFRMRLTASGTGATQPGQGRVANPLRVSTALPAPLYS